MPTASKTDAAGDLTARAASGCAACTKDCPHAGGRGRDADTHPGTLVRAVSKPYETARSAQ